MIKDWLEDLAKPGTETIKVAVGYCTPARVKITGVLKPYHIKVHCIDQKLHHDADGFATHYTATIRVNSKAAAWAEYVLLRSGKFELLSRPKNRKNAEWAAQYGGRMPTPWDVLSGRAKPWLDPECTHDPKTGKKLTKKQRAAAQYSPPAKKRRRRR